MALTRKYLSAMGIDDDKIDEIIKAHRETVDALKEERDSYKDDAENLPKVQKELETAKKQLADAVEADGKDKWKVKYDALKEEHDSYKASVEAEKTEQKKSDAYRELLKESGIAEKRIPAILRVTDLSNVEFGEDGKPKDADKLKDAIKQEWSDFIGKEETKGANTEKPPEGNGAGTHTPSRAAKVAARHYEMIYGKKTSEDAK